MTQTETCNGATSSGGGVFPPGRYGHRRERARRRWIMPAVLVIAVAIMALVSVKLYEQYGRPRLSPTVVKISDVTNDAITVTFRVHKSNPAAVCTVDALAYSGVRVGTADVFVPPGTDVQVTHTLSTSGRAYVANVPSCRAAKR